MKVRKLKYRLKIIWWRFFNRKCYRYFLFVCNEDKLVQKKRKDHTKVKPLADAHKKHIRILRILLEG